MNQPHITPLNKHHTKSYHRALDSIAREGKYLSFLEAPTLESTQVFIDECISHEDIFYIALVNNEVIAWCNIKLSDREIYKHVGLLGIGVIADFRGQKLGSQLMRMVIEEAKEKGLKRIELTVRENNKTAIRLYEKLGFKIEGVHLNAIYQNACFENQLTMALLI